MMGRAPIPAGPPRFDGCFLAATPLVGVPALGVLAIFLHDVPYVGLASQYATMYMPWLMVAALLGGALALSRLRRSRFAGGLAVLAVLVLVEDRSSPSG